MPKRIIPVSSGKGGVGKTTVALNYALSLSRHGKSILVDLDTGTSSVRSAIDTPISRDLYHFFKKGASLADCVTTLSPALDPSGTFSRFGFVAGPKHLIEDIATFGPERRRQVIDGINGLHADFVVLDLKAGLDSAVLDFLPRSNSGILVFTPHAPAATLAASDMVKAMLFRRLRAAFAPGASVYAEAGRLNPTAVGVALDHAEDVYEDSVPNLDAFTQALRNAIGDHPAVERVRDAVGSFVVHYVLNMFNGVQESYEAAVKPFAMNLVENVSSRLTVLNLGWVVAHEDIERAGRRGMPALLLREEPRPRAARDLVAEELKRLAKEFLGARPAPSPTAGPPPPPVASEATSSSSYLDAQLEALRRMSEGMQGTNYHDNFEYIAYRTLHLMSSRSPAEFGDTRLLKVEELPGALARRGG
jgi:MinD-like ATPase involved in chromosome partitioning or flagellar assembly